MPIESIVPGWRAPGHVKALSSMRHGGVSQPPFDALNLASHVGDEPASVARNRNLMRHQFGLPDEPCWLNQTHSTRVVNLATDAGRNADACFTRSVNQVAVILTADCLPILLSHRQGLEVAAIHAGWRGLADGIIEATVAAMSSSPDQLMAWIGPAISQKYFEVGSEVREQLVDTGQAGANRFKAARPGHWLCDLSGLASDCLHRLGVIDVNPSNLCSFEDEARFYSYRRHNTTGRMASMIWINSGT